LEHKKGESGEDELADDVDEANNDSKIINDKILE
jgi:hypothetical protein